MSDADTNPFADPEAANPFADPAVQQAKSQSRPTINEFNPFSENSAAQSEQTPQVPPPQPAQTQPAIMKPTEQPPAYTPSAAQAATDDLQKRQEELEKKAAEIERREQELRNQQYSNRRNNFPPLPEKCCVQPCFYQDISVEIPMEFQKIVRIGYIMWIVYSCCLAVNILGTLAALAALGASESHGQSFGLSILYFVLFTPCSFVCWFRPLYKAFRSDSSFNFFLFFFIFFFQFLVSVFQAIGIPGYGTCGFLTALGIVTEKSTSAKIVGVIMFLLAMIFTVFCVGCITLLIKVHRIYRRTGASFEKAQQEFAKDIMSNKTVQKTAATAATEAVSSQFSGGPSGNRY